MKRVVTLLLGISVLLFQFNSMSAAHAAATPITHYTFDETSGTTAHDVIGSVDGVLQGGAMFAPGAGVSGGALALNRATGGLVNMGDHFGFTSGSFSVETWVKLNPGDTAGFIPVGKHFGTIIAGYFLAINDVGDGCSAIGSAHFYVAYPCSGISSIQVNDGKWHQIVGAYNSANQTASIYVDGQFQSSSAGGNIAGPTNAPFLVGGITVGGIPTSGYSGLIDEVRLYDVALSPSEVQSIYSNTTTSGPDFVGTSIRTRSNYEFALEQGTRKTVSIELLNPGAVSRFATLEALNPRVGLKVSLPDSISLASGESRTLSIELDAGTAAVGTYDGLLLKVAVDDGTTLYSNITVHVTPPGAAELPDLTASASDVEWRAVDNDPSRVTYVATIHNRGGAPASNVKVRFEDFGTPIGETVIPEVPARGSTTTSIPGPTSDPGDRVIRVIIDPAGTIPELDEDNNEASRVLRRPGAPNPASGNIVVVGNLPARVCTGSLFPVSGSAFYDLTVNGVRSTDLVVKGGAVSITTDGATRYGDIHTDVNGNFSRMVLSPTTPGTYSASMIVTDTTLSGTGTFAFVVEDCPTGAPSPIVLPPVLPGDPGSSPNFWELVDAVLGLWRWICPNGLLCPPVPEQDVYVYSENILFRPTQPQPNQDVTIGAQVQYFATSTALSSNAITVNFAVTGPGFPRTPLPPAQIASIRAGDSRTVFTNWRAPANGIYIVEVEAVPTVLVEDRSNNAATRAIIVGPYASSRGVVSGQVKRCLGCPPQPVTVRLMGPLGTLGSSVTDANGFYLFENVPVGDFQVQIVPPAGYVADAEVKTAKVVDQAVSTVDFLLARQADVTPPVIAVTVGGTLGSNRWYTSDATVSWTVVDNESAITASTGCDTASVTTDTSGATFTCSATSGGGNASESVSIQRDATPPVVTVTGVADGASYTAGSVPVAGCATTDALSGVQGNATLSVVGDTGATTGTFIARCSGATDKAGNAGAASVTYQVTAAPPGLSTFSAFGVKSLVISPRLKTLFFLSSFTLGTTSNGIDPVKDSVTIAIGSLKATIPAGSFRKGPAGAYAFLGKINNVWVEALITPLGSNRFALQAAASGADLSAVKNPVKVGVTIGDDGGTTSVDAVFI